MSCRELLIFIISLVCFGCSSEVVRSATPQQVNDKEQKSGILSAFSEELRQNAEKYFVISDMEGMTIEPDFPIAIEFLES